MCGAELTALPETVQRVARLLRGARGIVEHLRRVRMAGGLQQAADLLGIETGIDLDKLIDAGAYISEALGRKPASRAATAILNKRAA